MYLEERIGTFDLFLIVEIKHQTTIYKSDRNRQSPDMRMSFKEDIGDERKYRGKYMLEKGVLCQKLTFIAVDRSQYRNDDQKRQCQHARTCIT